MRSKEEERIIRYAARRKQREKFADKMQQQASLKYTRARQTEAELQAKAKATGKTVAQLIVESWNEPASPA
jgi:hypothetical protein